MKRWFDREFISVGEAADVLDIESKTLYAWISQGKFEGHKFGGRVKVRVCYLKAYIRRAQIQPISGDQHYV